MMIPSDSTKMLERAAALCGEILQAVPTTDDTFYFVPSSYEENSLELFGDVVFEWRVKNGSAFLDYMIRSGKTYILNGIDGLTSDPNLSRVALCEGSNNLLVDENDWEKWLALRSGKHRKRIKQNLVELEKWGYQIRYEGPDYALSQPFRTLILAQVQHLSESIWKDYGGDYSCSCLIRRWPAIMTAVAQTEELHPLFTVVVSPEGWDVAALLTVTIHARRFFMITLLDRERAPGVGSLLLTHAVKTAVEDSSIQLFSMMMGNNHYKHLYEPDSTLPCSYQMAVYPKVPGYDSTKGLGSIPLPPFIAAGRLFTLHEEELPAALKLPAAQEEALPSPPEKSASGCI